MDKLHNLPQKTLETTDRKTQNQIIKSRKQNSTLHNINLLNGELNPTKNSKLIDNTWNSSLKLHRRNIKPLITSKNYRQVYKEAGTQTTEQN